MARFTNTQAILLALAIAALAAYPFVEGFQTSSTNPGLGDLFSQPWAITLLVIAGGLTAYGFLKRE